jgi:cytochrome c oxidase subunit 2
VSLFTALAGILTGMGVLAGPAMALSLNPEAGSPGIEKANTLHWIIFIVVVLAIVAINLALLRAARPRHRHVPRTDDSRSRKRGQVRVGLGLGVVALAIFVTATVFSDQSRVIPVSTETVSGVNEADQLEIKASGQQWLWRFDYPNAAFSYHRLVVPTGVTVALRLVSTDVVHGWNVPSLTGQADAVPGKTNWVYFRADEEGVHTGRSSILSGQGYETMEAKVEVVSPEEYETYVEQLKSEIQAAQNKVEQSGGAIKEGTNARSSKKDAQNQVQETAEADDE